MNLGRDLQKQAVKDYAFNYYLRKGVQLNVEDLLTKLTKQEEPQPLSREELQEIVPQPGPYWEDISFVAHFYLAAGEPVTLQQIGHLDAVKKISESEIYPRFKNQMAQDIRRNNIRSGAYSNDFSGSYSFSAISFMHGNGTVKGQFDGIVKWEGDVQVFTGQAFLEFSDIFSDPFSIIEKLTGNSNDPDVPYLLRHLANLTGTPYPITGEWEAELYGLVDRGLTQ